MIRTPEDARRVFLCGLGYAGVTPGGGPAEVFAAWQYVADLLGRWGQGHAHSTAAYPAHARTPWQIVRADLQRQQAEQQAERVDASGGREEGPTLALLSLGRAHPGQ